MLSEKCIINQLDALIGENRSIEQSEYLMAKRYNDTLLDIAYCMDALDTLKNEKDEVKLKYSSASKSIDKLRKEIEKVDRDIKQVNRDIERFAVRDNSMKDELMHQVASPTTNDLQTIFEKMLNLDLWNMFKYSNEAYLQEESNCCYNVVVDSFNVDAWEQFRLESTINPVKFYGSIKEKKV